MTISHKNEEKTRIEYHYSLYDPSCVFPSLGSHKNG